MTSEASGKNVPVNGFWYVFFLGVIVVAAIFMTAILVGNLYRIYAQLNWTSQDYADFIANPNYDGNFVAISIISQLFIALPVTLMVTRVWMKYRLVDFFQIRKPKLRAVTLWGALWIGFIVFLLLLKIALGKPISHDFDKNIYASAAPLWPLIFAVVIAAPIWEEFFFRGFLLSGFKSTIIGLGGAILISSLLFAIIHNQYKDPFILIEIFLAGIILCFSRIHSGSILVPIGLHMTYNLIAITIAANAQ